jgi:NTP pyrophosphatase (non-canonical NTP hydrolase)
MKNDSLAFQDSCRNWVVECLGEDAVHNVPERTFRFLEEALELSQAAGCSKENAVKLVDYVYSRPVGQVNEESGQVACTLASLCNAIGLDLDAAAKAELERCWLKIDVIRAKALSKRTNDSLPGVSA